MVELEERVEDLHEVLGDFIRHSNELVAAIHEDIAEIRASNARTDRQLLILQQKGDKDREVLTAMMAQAKKDRESSKEESRRRDEEREVDRKRLEEESRRRDEEREADLKRLEEESRRWDEELEAERKRYEEEKQRQDAEREAERKRYEEEKQRRDEEFERKWKKIELDQERAEKERKDFNRRLAEATDAQGLMIENMVWPNLNRVAREAFGDSNVLFSGIRLKRRLPTDLGRLMEIDLLAVGEKAVLVCEAKSKVDSAKVREFLERLEVFKEFFPEYAGLEVRPMIASVYFDPSVVAGMTKLNVLALGFGDETMEILNPEVVSKAG